MKIVKTNFINTKNTIQQELFVNRQWIGYAIIFFVAASFMITIASDTWWTLRAGQDFLAGKNVFIEQWTWSRNGTFWPNHELGWEIITYCLYKIAGNHFVLIFLFAAFLITATFFVNQPRKETLKHYKANYNVLNSIVLGIILYLFLLAYSELRAYLITFVLFALTSFLIRNERYFFIPIIFLIWANFHAGVSFGGMILFIAFLLSILAYIKNRDDKSLFRVKKIFCVGVLSFLLSLINPLGIKLWVYAFSNAGKGAVNYGVTEFLSSFAFPKMLAMIVACFFISFSVLMLKRFWCHWDIVFDVTVAFTFFASGLWVARNDSFAVIAAWPLVILGLQRSIKVFSKELVLPYPKLQKIVSVLLIGLAIPLATIRSNEQYSSAISPKAVDSLKSCSGNIWNSYNTGGVLLWFAPDVKLYQDNRFDYFSDYQKRHVLFPKDFDFDSYFKELGTNCVFAENDSAVHDPLSHDSDWDIKYSDNQVTLFVRTHVK